MTTRQFALVLGIAFALAGLILSVAFVQDSREHARHEARVLTGSLAVLTGTVLVSLAVALVCFSRLPRPEQP